MVPSLVWQRKDFCKNQLYPIESKQLIDAFCLLFYFLQYIVRCLGDVQLGGLLVAGFR